MSWAFKGVKELDIPDKLAFLERVYVLESFKGPPNYELDCLLLDFLEQIAEKRVMKISKEELTEIAQYVGGITVLDDIVMQQWQFCLCVDTMNRGEEAAIVFICPAIFRGRFQESGIAKRYDEMREMFSQLLSGNDLVFVDPPAAWIDDVLPLSTRISKIKRGTTHINLNGISFTPGDGTVLSASHLNFNFRKRAYPPRWTQSKYRFLTEFEAFINSLPD